MSDITLDRTPEGLTVSSGGTVIADYRVVSDVDAVNTPKPYFHPLRTLSGTTITGFAPDDHPWHHGLQFAFPRVGSHNLWGGGTYFGPERGYVVVEDQGSIQHVDWDTIDTTDDTATFSHHLEWRGHGGELLLTEQRSVSVTVIADSETPSWELQFETSLTNVTSEPLALETPAQRGRPDGGYGGLFLRLGEDLQADRLIGDDADITTSGGASRTLVIAGHTPDERAFTLGLSFLPQASPGAEKWLYRFAPEPFSAVGWAGAYDEGYELASGDTLSFAYRLTVQDGTVDAATVRARL